MKSIIILFYIALFTTSAFSSIYFEDFESGPASQVTTSGHWETGAPLRGPDSAYGGSNVGATNLNGYYSAGYNGSNSFMVTSSIILPNTNNLFLSFQHFLQMRSAFDTVYVEIERDGSNLWEEIYTTSLTHNEWEPLYLNITPYKGSTIKARFRLKSGTFNVDYGWYIDNITIDTNSTIKTLFIECPKQISSYCPNTQISNFPNAMFDLQMNASAGYAFSHWNIDSGSLYIENINNSTTKVSLTEHSKVSAKVIRHSRHILTEIPYEYDLTTDAQSLSTWFEYVADSAGLYCMSFEQAAPPTRVTVRDHGVDTTYNPTINNSSSDQNLYYYFTSTDTAHTYFFSAVPQYSNTRLNISGQWLPNPVEIALQQTLGGEIKSIGPLTVNGENTTTLLATPQRGYAFTRWLLDTGSVTFHNVSNIQSDLTVHSNSRIAAQFQRHPRLSIPESNTVLNLTTDAVDTNPLNGIWLEYTPSVSGSHTLFINNVLSTNKSLTCFGSDTTYTSVSYTESGYADLRYNFTATAGNTYYCQVLSETTDHNSNNIALHIEPTEEYYTFSIANTIWGGGHISGSRTISPSESTYIMALNKRYSRFNHWTTLSGEAVFVDSNSVTTYVSLISDAVLLPIFDSDSHVLINEPTEYTFRVDSSSYDYSYFLSFIHSDSQPGDYLLLVETDGYYDDLVLSSCSTFSYWDECDTTDFNNYSNYYNFSSSGITDDIYFNIIAKSSDYEEGRITASVKYLPNSRSLDLQQPIGGSAEYGGPHTVNQNDITKVRANVNWGYEFIRWESITAPSAVSIYGKYDRYSDVKLRDNATITPVLKRFPTISIDTQLDTFNLTTDCYQNNQHNELWFEFTAKTSGYHLITVSNTDSILRKGIKFYGSDTTHENIIDSEWESDEAVLLNFNANRDSTYIFNVSGGFADSLKDVSIKIDYFRSPATLTFDNIQHGYVRSLYGIHHVNRGDTIDIYSRAYEGYVLDHWSITSGSGVIIDTLADTTKVVLNSDTQINALYKKGTLPIYIGTDTLNYTEDAIYNNAYNGVWLEFTSPDSGEYLIETNNIDSAASRYFYYHGSDTARYRQQSQKYSKNTLSEIIHSTTPGEIFYFQIQASSYSTKPIVDYDFEITVNRVNIYPEITYHQGFEDSISDVYIMGDWETGQLSYFGSLYPTLDHEGDSVLGTNLGGEYRSNRRDSVIIGPIQVPDKEHTFLKFSEWNEMARTDNHWFSIQDSGTSSWYSYPSSRNSRAWKKNYIPLNSLRGSTIYLKFLIVTDASEEDPGWYIDNINIGFENDVPYISSSSSTEPLSSSSIYSSSLSSSSMYSSVASSAVSSSELSSVMSSSELSSVVSSSQPSSAVSSSQSSSVVSSSQPSSVGSSSLSNTISSNTPTFSSSSNIIALPSSTVSSVVISISSSIPVVYSSSSLGSHSSLSSFSQSSETVWSVNAPSIHPSSNHDVPSSEVKILSDIYTGSANNNSLYSVISLSQRSINLPADKKYFRIYSSSGVLIHQDHVSGQSKSYRLPQHIFGNNILLYVQFY